ncbi:MAG: Formate acetyltransferase [Planctomycetes bacterium ADurb.Bin126]|nr:MAG: Formate acetyltransferase [Planctomycetes bacterium ADurb.Bin126]HOD80341.1 formate C-acetyltransferase [Phycisphaerae bacterium]HQL75696.1 formate C-acetyltransferase [Phycisphaerae bacterium]
MDKQAWRAFRPGRWQQVVNVRDFIQRNYAPYEGDDSFLSGPTPRTQRMKVRLEALLARERSAGGVLDVDTHHAASVIGHEPGYIDSEEELIVGLQTDAPLRRAVNPFGGIRMAREACRAYGYELSQEVEEAFRYRTTHNDGVFRVYTEEMRKIRKSGLITGLPDAYGRGRLIGDYRRLALYGADFLIEQKLNDRYDLGMRGMTDETVRLAEELWKQADHLQKLKEMAWMYHYDISAPARSAREAVQWLYFAYLGAIKEQNGAAMSLGRVATFLDIYFERDIEEGVLDEAGAQEIVDDFVIKLRLARQLRTPDYNELFAGDPMWITEALGGMGLDGRTLVTRTSFRFLHTLRTLGPAPEPNLTVLWSTRLDDHFKRYCAELSIETDSIQYENDDLMRPAYGDDYGIACCVSATRIGKQMQYFGARCNLPKLLLLAVNGGRDERSGQHLGPVMEPLPGDKWDYDTLLGRFRFYRDWLCELYVNTMNVIHYMHDKYAYEKVQMALHDSHVQRLMAFGIAGLSVAADSLSAIRSKVVRPIRDQRGLVVDFELTGDYPQFGNDEEEVDRIAVELAEEFLASLQRHPAYRGSTHTLSLLTITSNVVYGKKTGATPDGRRAGEPFAPGANPMHNREKRGAVAALNSVAKLPYDACRDGISCTFSITPATLGARQEDRGDNLVSLLDGFFAQNGHHLNVNVLDREKLIDAMDHPENYPNLTIRVSGYAVNFHRLSREQQEEVISRTFHTKL